MGEDDYTGPARPGGSMQDLLTYAEASNHLNIKLGTLYALVSQGHVPHVRLGRRLVRFFRGDLDAWLRKNSVAPKVHA